MKEVAVGQSLSPKLKLVREHIRLENAHDLNAVLETFGAEANYDDIPWSEHHIGPAAVKSFYEELLHVLPDLHIDVRKEHETGEVIIVECVISGTQRAPWRNLPPTGRRIEFPLCGVYTFSSDGKLAGESIYYDRAAILKQPGIFREPVNVRSRILLFFNHPLILTRALLAALFFRSKL